MKIMTFGNFKGGTGKSSLAGLNAVKLANEGNRVLVIDLDYQMNLTKLLEANYVQPNRDKSIFNVLKRKKVSDNIVTITDNLDLLPASLETNRKVSIDWLDKALSDVDYDYIIIDTRPDIDVLVQSALVISDLVFIVLEPTQISLDGAITYYNTLLELQEEYDLKIKTSFIVNKFQNDDTFISTLPEEIKDMTYFVKYSKRIARYSNTGLPKKLDYHDRNVMKLMKFGG